jgi:hypothetical protein
MPSLRPVGRSAVTLDKERVSSCPLTLTEYRLALPLHTVAKATPTPGPNSFRINTCRNIRKC